MKLTLLRRAGNCAKVVEDLVTVGNWFHMWAIMYKKELWMTRLLYGGCTTFNPLYDENDKMISCLEKNDLCHSWVSTLTRFFIHSLWHLCWELDTFVKGETEVCSPIILHVESMWSNTPWHCYNILSVCTLSPDTSDSDDTAQTTSNSRCIYYYRKNGIFLVSTSCLESLLVSMAKTVHLFQLLIQRV